MSVPRRLGIGLSPDVNQSRTIQSSQRALLQQKIASETINQSMNQTNEEASNNHNSAPNSPGGYSHSSRPSSPGGYNANLYSPKPSPGVRINVASPAPSTGNQAPNSYNVLPALERGHRYVITGTLQQSLFGVVKLAFDRQLKIQVAIKISRRERAAQQQTRSGVSVLENVRREAAVMRYMYERSYAYAASSSNNVESLAKLAISSGFQNESGKKVKLSSRALQHVQALEEEKRRSSLPNVHQNGAMMEDDDKPHANVHVDSDTDTSPTDSTSDSDIDERMSAPATPYSSYLSNDPLDRAGERYICRFIEELEDEYFHYLISEFVPAGDLYSMLTSYPSHRLSENQARGIFRQMVLGMKYLHDRNIAHLDMSLENMCLDAEDQIRIIDFGVAAIHPFTPTTFQAAMAYFNFPSASTPLPQQRPVTSSPGQAPTKFFMCKPVKELYAKPGKIRYMSPELFQGLAWDAFANDIFSLGVILYSLLTGRPPFQQAESSDVWFHVIYSGQWLTPQIRKQPSAHVYTHLSESALDLVNRILKPQEIRPSCDAILQHPWMQQA